ncbi:Hypothetical predicted protein [Podarcis lilfordi]|uniref:Uncharacterized protein n=1 Tax=Podarcis lilfordi TaxID=74358 RepID=A0AA35NZF4_9SAUR|nr:Hypothetical predicted protein [Podarcis lilfordi]
MGAARDQGPCLAAISETLVCRKRSGFIFLIKYTSEAPSKESQDHLKEDRSMSKNESPDNEHVISAAALFAGGKCMKGFFLKQSVLCPATLSMEKLSTLNISVVSTSKIFNK